MYDNFSSHLRETCGYRRMEFAQNCHTVPFSSMILTLSDLTSNLVRQYDFPVPLPCWKMSDKFFVAFVRPLSEPVRRFSSCSTEFSQQIAQIVLLLFLHVFLFYNCRIITSNPPTSFPPKTNKSWGVCGWQKIGLENVKTYSILSVIAVYKNVDKLGAFFSVVGLLNTFTI
jgi:hypothetical protein